MVNWTGVTIGFVVTVVLETIGIMFISLDASVSAFISVFAPIIGGLLAAYWGTATYKDGIINGGLAGGLGSLLAAIISTPGNFILLVENSIISFVISGIAGSIGGLIGVLAKSNRQDNEKNMKE